MSSIVLIWPAFADALEGMRRDGSRDGQTAAPGKTGPLVGVIVVRSGRDVVRSGRDVVCWLVRPDLQKRGLGRKLWLHVRAQAIAAGQCHLPQLPGDDPA
jgi:ribosomal protein S18 acetylase RimI-like enzyme